MYRQTGGLVDHHEVKIFIQDRQSDRLRDDFDRPRLRFGHGDPISRLDTLAYSDFP
jgi:hypothetical protein